MKAKKITELADNAGWLKLGFAKSADGETKHRVYLTRAGTLVDVWIEKGKVSSVKTIPSINLSDIKA